VTKYVGAVIFEDSTKLYLIYDGMLDAAMRPLFPTEKAARELLEAREPTSHRPQEVDASEEAVTVITDVAPGEDGKICLIGSFASRASKKTMWLTGPRSYMEMMYENGATASRAF